MTSWILFGILSILLHVQKISAGVSYAYRHKSSAPLALIEQNGSPTFKLAIPRRYLNGNNVVQYPYDDENKKFKTACPAHTANQREKENDWRGKRNALEETKLFFLEKYTDWRMTCLLIDGTPGPRVRKINRGCGKSQGDIHEVGYSVSDESGWNIQMMVIYEICYSNEQNEEIIYTKHRIESPSLLLLKVYDDYEPNLSASFESPLRINLMKAISLYKKGRIYQFVPKHDMPTVLWQNTTRFPFNYTPLGPNRDEESLSTLKSMMKYDNVVRLFSQKTDKPLTIYSGTYQSTIFDERIGCFGGRCQIPIPINSFWRVIMDDEKNAIILITQYTKRTCNEETFMCYDSVVEMLEKYEGGGCTYKCALTDKIIDSLRLPSLNVKGKLDIRYPRPVKPNSEVTPHNVGGQSDTDVQYSSTQVDISDFGNGATLAAALIIADAVTAEMMQAEAAHDAGNGDTDGAADGVAHHGDGDTGNHADGDGGAGGGGGGGGWGIGGEGGG